MKGSIKIVLLALVPILFIQCSSAKLVKIEKQNKETIKNWFEEGWNKSKYIATIEKTFSKDWADGNPLLPGQLDGIPGMRQLVEYYSGGFPDLNFKISHMIADGNYVLARILVNGTHKGTVFGIPATGTKVSTTGIIIYEFKGDKVKTTWQELDLTALMNQIRHASTIELKDTKGDKKYAGVGKPRLPE